MPLAQLNSTAAVNDLRVLLGLAVESFDTDRGKLAIDLAVERVETVIAPAPALARGIVLELAVQNYTNPTRARSSTTGPFSSTYDAVSAHLSDQQRAELERIKQGEQGTERGAFTIHPGPTGGRRALDVS